MFPAGALSNGDAHFGTRGASCGLSVEENLVEIQIPRIPNPAPATNLEAVPSHRVKSSLGQKPASRLPMLLCVLIDLLE
jgi:hypothetical protein